MCTPGGTPTDTLLTPIDVTAQKMDPNPAGTSQARLAMVTQGLGTLTSAAGAFSKANADRLAAQNNANLALSAANNEQRVGDSQAQKLYAQTSQMKGTQRASFAARGLSLSTGSPLDILTSTDVMGAADQNTLKVNTQNAVNADLNKAAYYKSQASNDSPFVSVGTSLVTGASKVSDKWYDAKKAGLFTNGFFGS